MAVDTEQGFLGNPKPISVQTDFGLGEQSNLLTKDDTLPSQPYQVTTFQETIAASPAISIGGGYDPYANDLTNIISPFTDPEQIKERREKEKKQRDRVKAYGSADALFQYEPNLNITSPDVPQLPGFAKVKPQVYAGLFPVNGEDFEAFRDALEKLVLNDASLFYEPESSDALGFGFRCGFLGMLHMEIIQERLEREYNLDLITSAPTVVYEVELNDGSVKQIDNPSRLPSNFKQMREPIAEVNILLPQEYVGNVMTLCVERRGVQKSMNFSQGQVSMEWEMPLNEVVMDFFDRLKSVSRGFASLDYSFVRFEEANLIKLEILINGDKVDALASIVHRDQAQSRGRGLAEKMKELIPRQMFDVALQAAIGGQIVARQTVKALRKNVTAKCYGGDITRKKKLLEKQKEGKKRMKQLGSVEIPQEAFLAALKVER